MENRVKDHREKHSWSQGELARRLGVSRQTINAVETDKYDPSLPLALRMAKLFGVSVPDLFIDHWSRVMMSEAKEAPKKSTLKKIILPVAVGAVTGFLVAFGVTWFSDDIGQTGLSSSAEIAVLVGALYLMVSVFVGLGTLRPDTGAKLLNVEDADELKEQRSLLLMSSYAMGLWGAALVVIALGGAGGPIASTPALLIAGVLYALGLFFVTRSYALSDELMVAVNREAAVWSYGLVFAVLGGWSAFAHAGFVQAPSPLDILTAFYAMVLIATFIAAGRRGMLNVRG